MNETDPKRLRHHTPILPAKQDVAAEKARLDAQYDEATALGESEAGYSAAQRLLDEAVDAAVRPLPTWGTRRPQPVTMPQPEYEMKLASGETLTLKESAGVPWWCSICVGGYLDADTVDDAKPKAVALVIDRLERSLAELRFYQHHMDGKPSNGQPSVTAATSAALVEEYAGKEVSP